MFCEKRTICFAVYRKVKARNFKFPEEVWVSLKDSRIFIVVMIEI